jgi:hypothetical protein
MEIMVFNLMYTDPLALEEVKKHLKPDQLKTIDIVLKKKHKLHS